MNNRISGSSELKLAYIPRGDFSLRDFHHAVTSLPSDVFLPAYNSSGDASCEGTCVCIISGICTEIEQLIHSICVSFQSYYYNIGILVIIAIGEFLRHLVFEWWKTSLEASS